MKISFIIPAYNEETSLGMCLDAIVDAIADAQCDAEIIVVNNASTDRTKEIATAYAAVRVVDEHRKGIVWARQAGFAISTGDLLANIDADTLMPKGWIPTVLKEFLNDNELLALSGPYIYYDASRFTRLATKIFYTAGYCINRCNEIFFRSGSMLQGGNFVVRRTALLRAGGFDTSIEFYGEDTDIGRRIGKLGKVKWTFALPMYSSGRRFAQQGLLASGMLYAVNFLSVTFLKRPFSKKHVDVRTAK